MNVENIRIFEDNQGCIALVKNPKNNRRVKHIDLKFNYIRENLESKVISIEYIDTKEQQADILTKGIYTIHFSQFSKIREDIGLVKC